MKNWLHTKWTSYYRPTARVVSFVVVIMVMAVSFPGNDKFSYVYEVLRPWRYEDVIAPFDFPIYKTDAEVQSARDSIRLNQLPYYRYEALSETDVRQRVEALMRQYRSKFAVFCPSDVPSDTVQMYAQARLSKILNAIYQKGVITTADTIRSHADYEIIMISGNVSEPYRLSELYSLREAYTKLTQTLRADIGNRFGTEAQWPQTLVDRMPLQNLIEANVVYDEGRTEAALGESLEAISLTQGKVMSGQKIISTGDIVDHRTIRVLDSLKRAYEPQADAGHGWELYTGAGMLLLCLLSTVFLFLQFFRADIFARLHCVNFTLMLMTVFVVLAGVMAGHHQNISFVIPYVILPIVLRIFFDSRLAMYMHTITMLVISFMASNSQLFLLLHIPAGMIAIVSLVNLTRRMQIVRTAVVVFVSEVFTYVGYTLWQTGAADQIALETIVRLGVGCLLILLSYPLIYVFESVFGFLSDVTLMELSDTNHKLLRELSEKAPGTFQHSVQVGNLAQAVAFKLGANAMLVRAGAMYHDIGKLVSPMYFTENQAGGINPHTGMDNMESARIVIQHVQNGVKIAQKHNLPGAVVDFIRTHHGDSQARFFYINWCNEHPGEEPDMSAFSYPGPVPMTKEQAIVMMADAVEASSKSLPSYTDEAIDALVEKIVQMQVDNGQMRLAPLTFGDISMAKVVFKEKLKNIYRARIQYPELMK